LNRGAGHKGETSYEVQLDLVRLADA
jgi:hypothetical protein